MGNNTAPKQRRSGYELLATLVSNLTGSGIEPRSTAPIPMSLIIENQFANRHRVEAICPAKQLFEEVKCNLRVTIYITFVEGFKHF